MSLEKTVIDNIKRIRKEKGISQEKLAEACNTATSYIGLMEIYKNIPKLSTIEKIAENILLKIFNTFCNTRLHLYQTFISPSITGTTSPATYISPNSRSINTFKILGLPTKDP